ncbi:MAG: acetyltransferase-like isoleucine patch superfamily enzyme [Planctomycetota bacterium]|jgi:acetyltransferase-like isoleucine patch superfamily enzyme
MGIAKTIYARLFVSGREHLGASMDPALSERDAWGILGRVACSLTRGAGWKLRMGKVGGRLFVGQRVSILSPGHITCGRNVKFEDHAEVQGLSTGGVHFGDGVTVGRGASIRPSSYYGGELGEGMTVGARSAIGAYNWIGASGKVTIGSDVMLGPRVIIIPENHNFEHTDQTIREQGVTRAPVVIEDDCWIGCNVTILSGVTIGKGSIVAAGAVVNKSIPPGSIAGGVPARVIRSREAV